MRQLHPKGRASLWLVLALLIGMTTSAVAGGTDPLFINLTSDDAHRVDMALSFGKNQLQRGHPLTVFLNDRAVFVGAKANAGKFTAQQKLLEELGKAGATLIACPMCMKHYGIPESDLLPGLKVGNPDLTGAALFKDGTQTLTW